MTIPYDTVLVADFADSECSASAKSCFVTFYHRYLTFKSYDVIISVTIIIIIVYLNLEMIQKGGFP